MDEMTEVYDMNTTDSRNTVSSKAPLVHSTDQPVQDLSVFNFGDHVRVDFHELFSEPDAYKDNALGRTIGDKVIRIGYYNLFTYIQACFYYVLSVVLGLVMSLLWGVLTALNSVIIVWLLQPVVKLSFTWLQLAGRVLRAAVRCSLDPFCQSAGLSLSMIRAKLNLDLTGLRGGGGETADNAIQHL